MKYTRRIKESALKKILPPENRSIPDVAREMGISDQTIYNWKKQAENGTNPKYRVANEESASAEHYNDHRERGAERSTLR